jgi:hypothetical protein
MELDHTGRSRNFQYFHYTNATRFNVPKRNGVMKQRGERAKSTVPCCGSYTMTRPVYKARQEQRENQFHGTEYIIYPLHPPQPSFTHPSTRHIHCPCGTGIRTTQKS